VVKENHLKCGPAIALAALFLAESKRVYLAADRKKQ
jgi:hypothetical protein